MSYQLVRGTFESEVAKSLQSAGVAADHIFYDNVGETPPVSGIYATISISFTDTVVDTLSCEGLEDLRGSIGVNVYTPKNAGSKAGEDICLEVQKGWQAINRWQAEPTDKIRRIKTRSIEGPFTIAPDNRPFHVNNIACTWMARVGDLDSGKLLTTRTVKLTNPVSGYDSPETKDVALVNPVGGMTTQEDANKHFNERLDNLEKHHDKHRGHDSGSY